MTTITIAAVNQPKTNAAGQTSKSGTVTATDGTTYRAWLDKLPLFESLVGQTVEVNTDVKDYGTYITLAQRAGAPRPPVSAPTLPPRQSAPGGPVQATPVQHYQQRVHPDEGRQMYVSNFVARAMQSGKFVASEARVLTQAALESYWQQLHAVEPTKMPKPIETATNNQWTSEPPKEEPGDPGAQLQ